MSVLSDRGDLAHLVVTGTGPQTSAQGWASQSSTCILRVRALPGQRGAKSHSDNVFRRLNAFLFVVAILAYSIGLVAWVYGGSGVDFLDQSDTLQPFMMMWDAFRDPSSLFDWYTSSALYVFPDCLLAGLLLLLPVDSRLLPMLYAGCMVAGYAFSSAAVLRVYGRVHWMSATLITTAMLTLLLISYGAPFKFTGTIASYSTAPFFHTGAILAGLMLITGLGIVARSEQNRTQLVISLAMIVFLVSISDVLYVLWFVLPACSAVVFYLALTRVKIPVAIVVTFGLAIAAVALERFAHPAPYGPVPSDYVATFNTAKLLLEQSVKSVDLALLVPLSLAPLLVGRGLTILVIGARSRRFDLGDLGELILVSCFIAALATPLLTGALIAVDRLRYSLPIFLLPYLWIALALVRVMPRPLRLFPLVASAALLLVVALRYTPAAIAGTHHFASLRQPASCLIANGLSEGYADYWRSKAVMWNSDFRLHVIQLVPMGNVQPYRANYNAKWFRTHAATGAPLRPNFVNVFRLNEEKVLAAFGPPSRKIMCGIYPIWIYDHTLPLLD